MTTTARDIDSLYARKCKCGGTMTIHNKPPKDGEIETFWKCGKCGHTVPDRVYLDVQGDLDK